MNIYLEQINSSDNDTVLEIFRDAAEKISKKNIDHWQYWKNPPMEKVKWVEDGILKGEFFFVNNDDSFRIGMVRILEEDVLYWGHQSEKAKYIHSLVVFEEFQRKGIGEMIIRFIGSEAKKDGFAYLRLDSDAKNPKLCGYYEKQGFKQVGIKELPISRYKLYEKGLN